MRISWLGHACFMLEHEEYRVVIDPFNDVPGYRDTEETADAVLCSHEHFDHAYRAGVTLRQGKINPFAVEVLHTCHDEAGGTLRGKNKIHILRADGMTVAHLGDLGHMPDEEQVEKLCRCDAILIPVGGTYTLDADGAAAVVAAVQPRVVIPMHYRGETFGFDNIDTVEAFLAHFPVDQVNRAEENWLELTENTPDGVTVLALSV